MTYSSYAIRRGQLGCGRPDVHVRKVVSLYDSADYMEAASKRHKYQALNGNKHKHADSIDI
jgi:hypothetical protein